jgi:hypothetical protein
MKFKNILITACLMTMVIGFGVPSTRADIIVVEGKYDSDGCDKGLEEDDSTQVDGTDGNSSATSVPEMDPTNSAGNDGTIDTEDNCHDDDEDPNYTEFDDDDDEATMTCEDIGQGVELCTNSDEDSINAYESGIGCNSSGPSQVPWTIVFFSLALWITSGRRRRAIR